MELTPAVDSLAMLVDGIRPPDAADPVRVRAHLDDLTKPRGSLGRLEDVACRLACIVGDPPPELRPRAVVVLAGDHGVAARGVSAYPPEVTRQMCHNIADGGAAVSVFARAAGAEVLVADLGVREPTDHPDVIDHNVVRGTADLAASPALTAPQVERAILAGAQLVRVRARDARLLAIGEMGIGNTTPAAAITSALLGMPPAGVVGRGTGVDDAGLAVKLRAIEAGLARLSEDPDPCTVLAEVGGAEVAGLVGVLLEGGRRGVPMVIDGFISTAAALAAVRLAPELRAYLFASHRSTEPGHALQLAALELEPLLDLGLRLGEGSGAVLALPLLDAAAAMLREMATFSSAGVSGRAEPRTPTTGGGATRPSGGGTGRAHEP